MLRALLLWLAVLATAAHAAPEDAGAPVAMEGLAAGDSRNLALAAPPGAYVEGEMEVARGRFRLDLQEVGGRHLRRLEADLAGRATFRFIAPAPGAQLVVTALEPNAAARLSMYFQTAPAQPKAAEAPLLSPAVAALARSLDAGGTTHAFWQDMTRRGTPLIEPAPPGTPPGQVLATFLARGAQHNVRLLGAPSGDHEWLQRLGTSDTFFRSFLIPDDTRLSYRLAPDVPEVAGTARAQRLAILATAQADPFNRAPWPDDAPDAFNCESTLVLPGAPVQPEMGESGAPVGRLSHFPMASARLNNSRAITLYRPSGFDPHDPDLVLLVVFDGPAYLSKVPTPAILDALIAKRRLPPVLAVFVSPIDGETRGRELPGNDAFADFLADELMPAIRQMTGAGVPAGRTILAGSSYGGLAAATVALRHPQVFGNALALSGSFWWRPPDAPADGPGHVAELVARTPPAGVRFHLSAGLFETGHMGTAGILETSRHLRDLLRARGYDVSYGEYAGGHDYLVWRGALADGLLALAPRLPPGDRAPR